MNDLEAVRRLAAEPTDESVARTWYRITKLEAKRAPRRRRLVPAVAGLAVLAVVAASLVVYRMGQGVLFPVASAPEAVALLNSMADLAEAGPPVFATHGLLVRTESHGQAGVCSPTSCQLEPQDREQLYDPRQGQMVKLRDGERDLLGGSWAWLPPEEGILRPTFAWLTSLPIDRQMLLASLRKSVGEHDSWTVDHQLWDAMGQFYAYCEMALSPPKRAQLLRALAGVTGLSVRDLVVDGVPLVAIRQTDKDSGAEIIFDPATGYAVGRASVFLGDSVTIIPMPGGPQLDKGVMYQVTWKQTITMP
ncbi:MAG TPA: hypothetical protein VFC19_09285 [Candidatus Limnocylindrales bacterium]|nr:hypothetical protein [Candidatus Limnocylindrales bacterium]